MSRPKKELPKVPLGEWAASRFSKVPHIVTLRHWAASGQIKPAPEKVGREWMVDPTARYAGKATQ